jgi:hypothetical protein
VSGFARLATQPLRGDMLAMNPTITTVPVCQRRLAIEIMKRQVRIGSYNLRSYAEGKEGGVLATECAS